MPGIRLFVVCTVCIVMIFDGVLVSRIAWTGVRRWESCKGMVRRLWLAGFQMEGART